MYISKAKLILLGILCGIFSTLSFEVFAGLTVMTVVIWYISGHYQPDERKFVLSIFTFGVAIRIIAVIFYFHFYLLTGHRDILGPDGEGCSAHGWYISRFLTGQNIYDIPSPEQVFFDYRSMVEFYNAQIPPWNLYHVGIFSYVIAIIYAIFNYTPLLIKFSNSILGAAIALIVYELGKECFGKKVARISMIVVMFLPSMFIFSLTSMKDTLIIFFLVTILFLLIRYHQHKGILPFMLLVLATIIICFLKTSIFPILMLFFTISLFLLIKARFRKKIFVSVAIALIIFFSGYRDKIFHYFNLVEMTNPHIGYVNTPGNNYRIFADEYYTGQKDIREIKNFELITAFTKSIFHFLFEPFPNKIESKGELFGVFQTIPWMIFFPFVILGIIQSIRYKQRNTQYILIYIIVFCSVMAIGEGNVGTVFRHRDMLMPFFILFGLAGIYSFFGRTER